MLISHLDLNFDVLHDASKERYADNYDIRLVNLRPVAFFSIFKLITSRGKHLEDFFHTHIVSLMYKLITSAKYTSELFIGFHRDRGRRQHELTNNKNIKEKNHVRAMLKAIFLQKTKKKLLSDSVIY